MLMCLQILQHGDARGEGSGRYGGIGGPCKTQDFLRVYLTLGLALLEGTSRLKSYEISHERYMGGVRSTKDEPSLGTSGSATASKRLVVSVLVSEEFVWDETGSG